MDSGSYEPNRQNVGLHGSGVMAWLLKRALIIVLVLVALMFAMAVLLPNVGPCACEHQPNDPLATPSAHPDVRSVHRAAWVTSTRVGDYGVSGSWSNLVSLEPIGIAV
jgi:hypothetical protein